MKTLNLYNGEVELTFDEVKHAYKKDGYFIPGVTSILKIINKPALIQWAASTAVNWAKDNVSDIHEPDFWKTAATAHRRIASDAAGIGTKVHLYAEQRITGRKAEIPEGCEKPCQAFEEWLSEHEIECYDSERIVFSREHFFAGTCDFYGRIDGELCVLDFKTSSGFYPEMPLQLAAYAIAIKEEGSPDIEAGWIVRLDKKTGKCESRRYDLLDRTYKSGFYHALKLTSTMKAMEKLDGI